MTNKPPSQAGPYIDLTNDDTEEDSQVGCCLNRSTAHHQLSSCTRQNSMWVLQMEWALKASLAQQQLQEQQQAVMAVRAAAQPSCRFTSLQPNAQAPVVHARDSKQSATHPAAQPFVSTQAAADQQQAKHVHTHKSIGCASHSSSISSQMHAQADTASQRSSSDRQAAVKAMPQVANPAALATTLCSMFEQHKSGAINILQASPGNSIGSACTVDQGPCHMLKEML